MSFGVEKSNLTVVNQPRTASAEDKRLQFGGKLLAKRKMAQGMVEKTAKDLKQERTTAKSRDKQTMS